MIPDESTIENAKAKINANKARKINSMAGGNGLVVLYFNALRKFTQSAIMLADVSVISITTKQTNIEITIPAGSVLIIDMQNFTAYFTLIFYYPFVYQSIFLFTSNTFYFSIIKNFTFSLRQYSTKRKNHIERRRIMGYN